MEFPKQRTCEKSGARVRFESGLFLSVRLSLSGHREQAGRRGDAHKRSCYEVGTLIYALATHTRGVEQNKNFGAKGSLKAEPEGKIPRVELIDEHNG